MPEIVQGLWIGTALSVMEQLSITSFLRHGHTYHLYVYDDVQGIPVGTVVQDGNELLPASCIFQYTTHKTYAAFSNFFRYKLLLEKGGWWADTDIICLKPLVFDDEYVFATEWSEGQAMITSGIIKVPAGSAIMAHAWQVCQTKEPAQLRWGEVGPRLLAAAVMQYALEAYVKPHTAFCPLGYEAWAQVLEPQAVWAFDDSTQTIHLWNEMWRRSQCDKNQRYHPACLYEQLKETYLYS